MPWVRIDDGIVDHLKTLRMWSKDPEAFALDVRGIAWSAKQLTDGFVPDEVLELWYTGRPERLQAMTEILVDVERWERAEGGFTIHDFLEYNPSKEKVLETRAKRAVNGGAGGKASGKSRREKARETIDQSLAEADRGRGRS